MDISEKSKNKGRPYPLRRVLLVMVIGVAFMFWMPFVIITRGYFHWLNYVIYWGAAVVWLMPLAIWLKRHAYMPRLHRLRTVILLLGVWLLLIGGGWFITKRGLLPPVHETNLRCGAYREQGITTYYCSIRQPTREPNRLYGDYCEDRRSAPECYVVTSRLYAEGLDDFPLTRTFNVITDIEFLPDWYRRTYCCGVADG
jgi:hypothetical protein